MLKAAIIGTGAISDNHIKAYQKFSDKCQIVGMVDLYPEKAQKKAQKYGLEIPVFNDYHNMIAELDFDLVSICLPPFIHAQSTIDLLNAGKHVLLEKPMATSLEKCDLILNAAQNSGKLLSIVAQNRFKNSWMKFKKVLSSGMIGKIIHARIDSFWWRGNNYYDLWWRGTWEKEGGGCTLNHAVHHIDLFQWMMGMPVEVQAVIRNLAHKNSEVEDFSSAIFYYENGALGQVTSSLVHHGEEQEMVVQGEKAMVSVPWTVKASQQMENGFPENDPDFEAQVRAFYDSFPDLLNCDHDGQVANFLAAINGEEDLLVDGNEGRKTMELVTAIYQSGTLGEIVKLPLTPDSPFYTQQGILDNAVHFHEKTKSVDNFATDEITFARDTDQ